MLGWGLRMTMDNLASIGALFVRALPVVLLTVLVFFNSYVWLMAATISRARLWLALLFLVLIAVAFIMSARWTGSGRCCRDRRHSADDDERLTGTPFETMPDRRAGRSVVAGRTRQRGVRAGAHRSAAGRWWRIVAGLIFFVLGLILLSPELLAQWTRNGSTDGQILGMTLPVPQSLIQISMFLAR